MPSTAKPMLGVRLPAEQAAMIRQLANASAQTPSIVIREIIAEGLAKHTAKGGSMT